MKSPFSRLLVFPSSRFLILAVVATLLISQAAAQVVEIPDPNLREAIREQLQLPAGTPITQQDMEKLYHLDAYHMDIADLTGLEYATNLESLNAWDNPISDIQPLANLTKLRGLDIPACEISDITPLQNLTQLEELKLLGCPILDYSPIENLSIPRLIIDKVCDLLYIPIRQRIQNRNFPAIFSAWTTENLALHDLHWGNPLRLTFAETDQGWRGYIVEEAQALRDELLASNPNMLLIIEVRVRDAVIYDHPEDFPYWLRDENGNISKAPEGPVFLTDFTQPGMQDIIVQQAIAVAKCGLYDGIFFDWFAEDGNVLVKEHPPYEAFYTLEQEQQAKDTILQRIRAAVRDDFLIIINTGRTKIPRRAWDIKGTFMETIQDRHGNPYTREGLKQIESTILWAEENLREPQINCLEGWGIPTEPPDSPNNRRWMRVFTTMSLTHSDGYVLYIMNNTHEHIWHNFWDANLGQPVGAKSQLYQNTEGLFIREFTNGWAVYNRSGTPQTITLPASATPVSDRGNNAASQTHLLPDLDGEIYLKVQTPPMSTAMDTSMSWIWCRWLTDSVNPPQIPMAMAPSTFSIWSLLHNSLASNTVGTLSWVSPKSLNPTYGQLSVLFPPTNRFVTVSAKQFLPSTT